MPKQIKKNVNEYSAKCSNLVYANSGLYCIEKEMENFASRYASYNKCQAVYTFLKDVIDKTNKQIERRKDSCEKQRERILEELEIEKANLLDEISGISKEKELEFDGQSKAFVKEYLSQNLNYRFGTEELEQINKELSLENNKEHHFSAHAKKYDKSRDKMLSNIKKNGAELIHFDNSYLDKLKNTKDDFFQDLSEFRKITAEKSTAKKQIDEETSDELMQIVKDDYRNNILEAYEAIDKTIKDKWKDNAQSLRSNLIDTITESEALSDKQRKELSEIIINYQPISFEDDIDNVFVKEKFLKIRLFGDDEKLNIRKLASRYNSKIEKAIKNMANDMNKSCFDSFKRWKDELSSIIELNITEYNPSLRELSELIQEETDRIAELENDKSTIHKSLEAIEDLMNWKEIE